MNTKIKHCNEDVAIWIERSRKDYEAAKLLKTKDPALTIYLLQQCIEKSVKALAVASGKFNSSDFKRKFRHNSKELLIELWQKLAASESSSTLSSICDLANVPEADLVEALKYTIELKRLSLFPSPIKFEQNETLELSLRINGKEFNYLYEYNESPPSFILLGTPLERPGTESLIDLTIQFSLDSGMEALVARSVSGKRKIKASLESQFSKDRLLFSLFLLAALTYTHEASTRYPGGKIGCQDYTDNLPIVKHMGLLYEILDAVLPEVDYFLKSNSS
jgi:HEPN domain-containing protein